MASGDWNAQLIEQVVREVLASLQQRIGAEQGPNEQPPAAPSGEPAKGLAPQQRADPEPTASRREEATQTDASRPLARFVSTRDGELVLSDRVITLAQVSDRLEGIRRVVVPMNAVVTPAVRDLLQEKGIPVFYGGEQKCAENGNVSPTRAATVTVLLVTQRINPQQLDNLLRSEGISAEYETLDCLIRASERAAELCRKQRLVVVVTRHVAAEVCLANRQRGVRAIVGRDPQAVAGDTAAVGANVLVADLSAGLFNLKRMIRQFVASSHICPEVFREKLELQ
ncbi:hypothetical protein [Thermogutta sp.]|uniref:hypothetical protein n=1 Tax=Thermogutta sp. TaxID=1962930 RepID=UPI00321FD33A